MNAIELKNVAKHFRKQTVRKEYTTLKSELVRWLKRERKLLQPSLFIEALKGVDLTIPQGKTVGIIGRNGSGKSTLLKLITGIYTPSAGEVKVNGRISALLDLGAGFHPDFTGRENIYINGIILGMSRGEVKERVQQIIDFSELGDFVDEPVRTYSSGMYMRLAFAVATHVDPEILIVDEILAVGDEHFAKKSHAKMTEFKRSGKTIVLVTHDLGTVTKWCDAVAWIDGGRVRMYGDPTRVVEQYRQAVAAAEAQADATGTSALSAPGRALPELPATTEAPVVLEALRLLNAEGEAVSSFDTDQSAEVCLELTPQQPLESPVVHVELTRRDGLVVFSTSTALEDVRMPRTLSGKGEVRLFFERLGLAAGDYRIETKLAVGNAVATRSAHFEVQSRLASDGVVRPVLRWQVVVDGVDDLPIAAAASR